MRFRVIFEGRVVPGPGADPDAPISDKTRLALVDAMDELNRLGKAAGNAAIEFASSTRTIVITCAVEADEPGIATQFGSDNIYLSLNKAGFGTPRWPQPDADCWRVEPIRSSAEELAPTR